MTQAQACRLLPGMIQFGVGLQIIYFCDMILPGCYLEEKDVWGRALLGILENTNSLSCFYTTESGKCFVFVTSFNIPEQSARVLDLTPDNYSTDTLFTSAPTGPGFVQSAFV